MKLLIVFSLLSFLVACSDNLSPQQKGRIESRAAKYDYYVKKENELLLYGRKNPMGLPDTAYRMALYGGHGWGDVEILDLVSARALIAMAIEQKRQQALSTAKTAAQYRAVYNFYEKIQQSIHINLCVSESDAKATCEVNVLSGANSETLKPVSSKQSFRKSEVANGKISWFPSEG